jgi:hypothetical protein
MIMNKTKFAVLSISLLLAASGYAETIGGASLGTTTQTLPSKDGQLPGPGTTEQKDKPNEGTLKPTEQKSTVVERLKKAIAGYGASIRKSYDNILAKLTHLLGLKTSQEIINAKLIVSKTDNKVLLNEMNLSEKFSKEEYATIAKLLAKDKKDISQEDKVLLASFEKKTRKGLIKRSFNALMNFITIGRWSKNDREERILHLMTVRELAQLQVTASKDADSLLSKAISDAQKQASKVKEEQDTLKKLTQDQENKSSLAQQMKPAEEKEDQANTELTKLKLKLEQQKRVVPAPSN